MLETIQNYQTELRLGAFIGLLFLFVGLEALFPRRKRTQARATRWITNLSMVFISNILVRILFPVAAIGVAVMANTNGWGLLNIWELPVWGHILISILLLDFAIYWQHVASHKIPILWAFHKMHHADRDIDATTGIRFHPVEIVFSMIYKMLVILVLGPHMIGVLLFEVVLNGSAMFNHANMRLPLGLDRVVRYVFVTPDMHRVHHSTIQRETDSNYGFNVSFWDRLFGSYVDQPEHGHDEMTIGLAAYQSDQPSKIIWSLALPFTRRN